MNPSCLKSSKHPYSKNIPPVINHPSARCSADLLSGSRSAADPFPGDPSYSFLPYASCPFRAGAGRKACSHPLYIAIPLFTESGKEIHYAGRKEKHIFRADRSKTESKRKIPQRKPSKMYASASEGQKAVIKAHAESQGESMNDFVVRAIDEAIEQDAGKSSAEE